MRKIILLILSVLISIIIVGCDKKPVTVNKSVVYNQRKPSLNIITTNSLSETLIKYIAGDNHDIESIFYDNIPDKEFEFTDDAISNISSKDLFFYLGDSYEPWIDSMVNSLNRKTLGSINMSRGIKIQNYDYPKTVDGKSYSSNPYYYYSLENLKAILLNIKTAIQEKDPKNRDIYEDNFKTAIDKIDDITSKVTENSKVLENAEIIYSGDSLDYYFKDLGINTIKVDNENISQDTINNIKNEIEKGNKDNKKIIWVYDEQNQYLLYDEIIKTYNIKLLDLTIDNKNVIKSQEDNLNKIIYAISNN